MQFVNNFALEPYSKVYSFHNLSLNRNICQISMRFEEANCACNNWFTEIQLWIFGRNCSRGKGFICSLLVTQVLRKKKKKMGGHYKTAATKRLFFFLSIKAYVKRSGLGYFWFLVQKFADKCGLLLSLKFYKANRRLTLPKKNSNFGRKDVSF